MRFVFEIEPYEIGWIWDRLTEKADAWAKEQEMEDDDAEDESCNCDDESTEADACDRMFPETADEKAHRKALDKLAECLRASGVADVTFHYCGHAKRSNGKR